MPTRIVMVCLGNICRSPLAEGILKSKVNSEIVLVDSAGTAGYHEGNPPDPRSISVARKYGLDISRQRSRKFTHQDFVNFDIIYAMDHSNYAHILAMAKNDTERAKVKMLLEEGDSEIKEVPDPYYGSGDGFEKVYHLLDSACSVVAEKYTKKPYGK